MGTTNAGLEGQLRCFGATGHPLGGCSEVILGGRDTNLVEGRIAIDAVDMYCVGGIVKHVADGFDLVIGNVLNLDIAMIIHPNGMFGN